MRRVDVAYVLITNDERDRVLMVRNGGSMVWSLPGGAVEPNESLDAAAIREAKEETGLDIEVGGICAVNECVFEGLGEHAVFFTFKAKIAGGEIEISRPDEIVDVKWVPLEEADRLMPYHKDGVQALIGKPDVPYHDQGRRE
ncbi:NUDIX hydrolase [Paenibacillus sp. IB182493]|uniref:NUDIX hydrolase n=1 Tax=Paenibacillus arenilitoris TaxID=2772299 RepID=A0A927CNK7_9BACL|nr:NUDIX hydrolase [Paenibacillus arenilitoris]